MFQCLKSLISSKNFFDICIDSDAPREGVFHDNALECFITIHQFLIHIFIFGRLCFEVDAFRGHSVLDQFSRVCLGTGDR